ncbi:MAG: hypothetical protein LBK99_10485, partial [Opitutaceae bacterium]|nr:hypothetical protein [Opitutaceae bacterium]
DIEGENMTDNGRIVAVLRLPGHIIIAEFKYRPPPPPPPGADASGTETEKLAEKLLADAFTQMREKRYAERYATTGTTTGADTAAGNAGGTANEPGKTKLSWLAVAFVGKHIACRIETRTV